jgi:hypothetical protein
MRGAQIVVLALTLASITAGNASAQRLSPERFGKSDVGRVDAQAVRALGVGGARLAASVGGLVGGMFLGGAAGYRVLPHCNGCEDPGLDAMIYGAFVGGAIGAALGAAGPTLRSSCSFDERFARTIVGAGAGMAGAFLLGGRSGTSLIIVPVSSVAGALGSLGRCWK